MMRQSLAMDSLQEVREYDSALINGKMWYICTLCPHEDNRQEVADTVKDIVRHVLLRHKSGRQPMPLAVDTHPPWSPSPTEEEYDVNAADDSFISQRSIASDIVATDDEEDGSDGRGVASESDPILSVNNYCTNGLAGGRHDRQMTCTHEGCPYKTGNSVNMTWHLADTHGETGVADWQPYRCDREGCDRSYDTFPAFQSHVANHRCGYRFDNDPTVPVGPCHRSNLIQYCEQQLNNARKPEYWCRFKPCPKRFRTPYHSSLMDHIHRQHVCPYRPANGRRGRTPLAATPGPSGGQTVGGTQSGSTTAMRTGAKAVAKSAPKKLSEHTVKKEKGIVSPIRGCAAKSTTSGQRKATGNDSRYGITTPSVLSQRQENVLPSHDSSLRPVPSSSGIRSQVMTTSISGPKQGVSLASDSNRTLNSTQTAHNSRNSLEMDGQRPPVRPSDENWPEEAVDAYRSAPPVVANGVESRPRTMMLGKRGGFGGFMYKRISTTDGFRYKCETCGKEYIAVKSVITHIKTIHLSQLL